MYDLQTVQEFLDQMLRQFPPRAVKDLGGRQSEGNHLVIDYEIDDDGNEWFSVEGNQKYQLNRVTDFHFHYSAGIMIISINALGENGSNYRSYIDGNSVFFQNID